MATPNGSSPIEIGTLAQWAAASATLLAVLVALFKDEILRWWRKPRLTVSVALQPPDCHKTTLDYTVQRTTLIYGSAECYYLRLWIGNAGQTRAERVQVFARFREMPGQRPSDLGMMLRGDAIVVVDASFRLCEPALAQQQVSRPTH